MTCLPPRPISSNLAGPMLLMPSLLLHLSPPMVMSHPAAHVSFRSTPPIFSFPLPQPSMAPHCSENGVLAPRPAPKFSLPSNPLHAPYAQANPTQRAPPLGRPGPLQSCHFAQLQEARAHQRQCPRPPPPLVSAQPARPHLATCLSGSPMSSRPFPLSYSRVSPQRSCRHFRPDLSVLWGTVIDVIGCLAAPLTPSAPNGDN